MKTLIYVLIFLTISVNSCIAQFYEQNFVYKLPSGTVNVDAIYTNSVNLSYTYKNNGCEMIDVKLQYWTGFSWSDFTIDSIKHEIVVYGASEKYGFTANTLYYGRLRLENCVGIYDVLFEFTTMESTTSPTVITNAASSITTNTAILNGNVTDDGGETVTGRGFYWGQSFPPTTKVSSGSGTGTFTTNLSLLLPYTDYYFQAYAENVNGEARGLIDTFTTNITTSVPTVTTTTAINITANAAISGGNVTYDGNSAITEKGVYYSTSPTPTSGTSGGTGIGAYSVALSYLSASTTYYYRAYAKNSSGTGYGSELSFTTLAATGLATVVTLKVTDISTGSATLGGNVTADGGSSVTQRGVCYGTSPGPTTGSPGGIGTGSYTVNISYLTPGTKYYYRAYAINSNGISYGAQYTFTTLIPSTAPVVSTFSATEITTTTAIAGGGISYDGNSAIIESGVCYSTSSTPTIANSKVISGATGGGYYVMLTGLSPSTIYYYRAYATNGIGTGYGTILSFTTSVSLSLPTVTASSITNITISKASGGGNVTADGGSTVTSRGLVWNKTGNPSLLSYIGITDNGTGTGAFSSSLTNLEYGTTYYVRAYATNSVGTAYSDEDLEFTTSSAFVPVSLVYEFRNKSNSAPAYVPSSLYFLNSQSKQDTACVYTPLRYFSGAAYDSYKLEAPLEVGSQMYVGNPAIGYVKSIKSGYYLWMTVPTIKITLINGIVTDLTNCF